MKKKNKRFKSYEKILRNDKDWDFVYMIYLEKKKLQRMYTYFSEGKIVANFKASKEIAICIRLIDIFLENDPASKAYYESLEKSTIMKTKALPNGTHQLLVEHPEPIKFPKHVNHRNEKRFHSSNSLILTEAIADEKADPGNILLKNRVTLLKSEFRKEKAFYLYNKIRALKMTSWYD